MKRLLLIFVVFLVGISVNSFAGKPEWVKEKQSQKVSEREVDSVEKGKGEDIDTENEQNEIEKTSEDHAQRNKEVRGLEKQKAKKQEQVQKELDKGSEQGREARSKRKKWWKFWE